MHQEDGFFTASDGTRIHYLDIGEGIPVIVPHGYGCNAELFREQFMTTSDRLRCISFDQRGYGQTPPDEAASLALSARDMHDLIRHLELEEVMVVGYSMGASVLFAYVRQFGCEYLKKVVIGDMSPKLLNDENWKLGLYQGWFTQDDLTKDTSFLTEEETRVRNYYFYDQLLFLHQADEERRCPDPVSAPLEYKKMKERIDALEDVSLYNEQETAANRYYMKSMGESDFRDVLPEITVPALLVYASPGSIYNEETGRYIESKLPDASFLKIENAGHCLTPEQNTIYWQEVIRFFREEAGRSDPTL